MKLIRVVKSPRDLKPTEFFSDELPDGSLWQEVSNGDSEIYYSRMKPDSKRILYRLETEEE